MTRQAVDLAVAARADLSNAAGVAEFTQQCEKRWPWSFACRLQAALRRVLRSEEAVSEAADAAGR